MKRREAASTKSTPAKCGAQLALVLAAALAGCNTTPLAERDWVEVETLHYDIVSSLGEKRTADLARDVESFRRAAEYVFGRTIPRAQIRTRVYAFDDRGFNSKFGLQNQSGYFLPRLRGDLIVLRAGGGWAEDASKELKLRYARRLFRSGGSLDLPPWYDEGFSRLASTLVVERDRAQVGILDEDHVRRLQRSNWAGVERVLEASSLEGWSDDDREMFDLESWAIAHYLAVGSRGPSQQEDLRGRYLAALQAGDSLVRAAARSFGADFGRNVRNYATAGELTSLSVRLNQQPEATRSTSRSLETSEVLAELGRLSLAVERAEQAREYFWEAASRGPKTADLWAGTGTALALERDWAAARKHFEKALQIDADNPWIRLDYANALRSEAQQSPEAAARTRLVELARDQYRRSLALDASVVETHAMLARSYLVEGEDASAGLPHVERALKLTPGSLRLRLLRGHLRLRAGRQFSARVDGVKVLTRARTPDDLRAARALLEEVDRS